MKCQKCGKNEVNFHYTANINGNVTEKHLCSSCAAESGYDIEHMFTSKQFADFGNIFNEMFPVRSGLGGFMPMAIPVMQANTMYPFIFERRPGIGSSLLREQGDSCTCGCGKKITRENEIEVDKEMNERRELNMQMRSAIENEEFEKAAELRDKIRALESRGEA